MSFRAPNLAPHFGAKLGTTDDYIMAVYYNKTNEVMRDEQGFFREGVKSTIRIFEWYGQAVKQLNLDRRISNITYDEIIKRIIGN